MFKLPLGLLLAGLVTSAGAACDWSNPGEDPYTGRPDKAVEAFKDLPWMVRRTLSQKVGRAEPDDLIDIGKDEIKGSKWTYANEIRNMHFGGAGKICPGISRDGWAPGSTQPAKVWCTREMLSKRLHCVGRADICGNYFQVTQVGTAWAPARAQANRVPEPGTLALVGLGLAGLWLRRK